MTKKKSKRKIVTTVIYWLAAALIGCYLLFPFFVLLSKSFMSIDDILRYRILPSWNTFLNEDGKFSLARVFTNFVNAFKTENLGDEEFVIEGINMGKALFNSLKIMFFRTAGITISSFLSAFALSRIKFRGRNILFSITMVTVMLPGTVTMIPLRVLYYNLGWMGTHYPLWVPACFGGGFTVIFMEMQFIRALPRTMDEAAIIDGANYFQICMHIILPLVAPVIIFTAVNAAIGSWNDFMAPLTYIPQGAYDLYTLPLAFFEKYTGKVGIVAQRPNEQMALAVVMIIPIFVLFACFKEQMIHGVAIGAGVKG